MLITREANVRRVRVAIDGVVQGVGFRPFVYRIAQSCQLAGFVRNDSRGVLIEVEGAASSIDDFLRDVVVHAPPHAQVAHVLVQDLDPRRDTSVFRVEPSTHGAATTASIPADLATCDDCFRELFDPRDRRFRYPFINCTNCGPRFTIARGLPYDRASTTMAAFAMCAACRDEYENPLDRRFHAEPIACPSCGPRVTLRDARGAVIDTKNPILTAARSLYDGAIVAIKGLGGYHLAVRADHDPAVRRLRARKRRDAKPFAVMVSGVNEAARLAELGDEELHLLTSSSRPIVLLERKSRAPISANVAPCRAELGLMLPYTPLHHLLLDAVAAPLVMTSGNASDEPIAYRDDEAIERLGDIADLFLTHDRAIETRCDDSVVRVVNISGTRQSLFVRRSRGFVPQPIELPAAGAASILAVGGQIKNTICLTRGDQAVVGPHGGDLDDWMAFAAYAANVEHMERLTGATAAVAAHDVHPEYLSTKFAHEARRLRLIAVQHHHAHLAACLAEHGVHDPAIGLIFDGVGLGTDGVIWGGEILLGDLGGYTRIGHLRPIRMPGGDAATREPWRMACAWLAEVHDGALPERPESLREHVTEAQWARVHRLAANGSTPITTSVGRLLDACAAICGLAPRIAYEGQAAIELEAISRGVHAEPYPINVEAIDDSILIDPRPLVQNLERDVAARRPVEEIAASVHGGLVYAGLLGARAAAHRTGVNTVVLSGGVFQNVLLLEALSDALVRDGLRVLVPRRLPPNDGGLSYGQAAVAAWRENHHVSCDPGSSR